MFDEPFDLVTVSAVSARAHVVELEAERALAAATGVAMIAGYMEDLEWELEAWREVYVTAAVTEIASLRAQLDGPLLDG
jgi:predicted phage gp36 major capsid-like protein